MSFLANLSEYIVGCRFSDADRRAAALHTIDALIAYAAGGYTDEGRALRERMFVRAASQEVTRTSAVPFSFDEQNRLDRLLLKSATIRLTEVDDIHRASCITPASVIVPTACELFTDISTMSNDAMCDFLDSILIGYEVMSKLGMAIDGARIVYRGVWSTLFCAAFGAAAVSARQLRLPQAQVQHALALALNLSIGATSRGTPLPYRWFTLGHATRAGCVAAMVAANGFTGEPAAIDSCWFQRMYGIQVDTEKLCVDLHEAVEIYQTSLKPYGSAKQVIPAIEGLRAILTSQDVSWEDVQHVYVYVPAAFFRMIDHPPTNRLSSLSSVSYQLALSVYHPSGLYDINRGEILGTEDMRAFMNKVTVVPDEGLSKAYPRQWATRVQVSAGTYVLEETVDETPGDAGMPLTTEQLAWKWTQLLQPIPEVQRRNELRLRAIAALDDITSLHELMQQVQAL
ncbi:propanediol utilization protein [Alicyclobacillus acidoterrestris]|nr:propanediol utilization protein [Alicyclobacillus acidoterrestris]